MNTFPSLKQIIEKSRYEKEKGEKYKPDEIAQVFDYSKKSGQLLFAQYSDVPKLGIYPQSKYNTPIGIYAYPASFMDQFTFEDGSVPFAGERKYIVFFILKKEYLNKILFINSSGEAENFKDLISQVNSKNSAGFENIPPLWQSMVTTGNNLISKLQSASISPEYYDSIISILNATKSLLNYPLPSDLNTENGERRLRGLLSQIQQNLGSLRQSIYGLVQAQQLGNLNPQNINNDINNLFSLTKKIEETFTFAFISPAAKAYTQTDAGIFWNITREQSKQNPKKWAQLLMSMGIEGIVDRGSGIIHPSEPIQSVFFSSKPIQLLKIIENPVIPKQKQIKKKKLPSPGSYEKAKNLMKLI